MIAVQLEQTSNTSNQAGQYVCLHADYMWNQMTGWQRRVDRQNAPEEGEAFQLLAGRSYAPMHRLSLVPVGHPFI